jgi:FkbM family methyltransferase
MSLVDEDSVCYSLGVGEDITFDLDLIRAKSTSVFAFDPTPRAIEYARSHGEPVAGFHFEPVGIYSRRGVFRFYAPENTDWVSHSIENLQRTSDYFEAECVTLSDAMSSLGHDHVDLLKMDIEGAEYEVLQWMLANRLYPSVLLVEFDQPAPFRRTVETVREWQRVGYELVSIRGWDYTFVLTERTLAG